MKLPSNWRVIDPDRVIRLSNLALTLVWAAMVPVAYVLGWLTSVAFISLASIYANFASHLAAWRSDVNPDEEQLDRIENELMDVHRKLNQLLEA